MDITPLSMRSQSASIAADSYGTADHPEISASRSRFRFIPLSCTLSPVEPLEGDLDCTRVRARSVAWIDAGLAVIVVEPESA